MNVTNRCPVCKNSSQEELMKIKKEGYGWVKIMLCSCGNVYYYLEY